MVRKRILEEHKNLRCITEDFIWRMTPDEIDAIAMPKEETLYAFVVELKQLRRQEELQ